MKEVLRKVIRPFCLRTVEKVKKAQPEQDRETKRPMSEDMVKRKNTSDIMTSRN